MSSPLFSTAIVSMMMGATAPTDQECLALNAYHEARDQSDLGMMAVSQVVMNRVKDTRYPDTICDVVRQQRFNDSPGAPIRHNQCQFSWYCDGKSDKPYDDESWRRAVLASSYAYHLLENTGYDITEGATHYHANYVTPSWIYQKTETVTIDDHIFYRWEK